jgi:ArsR family transcriptional regulator, cadmium/lead-responsive transcriptional repressor
MSTTRSNGEGCAEHAAALFAALGHTARLAILDALADRPQTVGELAVEVRTTQPMTSQHLAVLRRAGLVARVRTGNTVVYSVADEDVVRVIRLGAALVTRIQAGAAC